MSDTQGGYGEPPEETATRPETGETAAGEAAGRAGQAPPAGSGVGSRAAGPSSGRERGGGPVEATPRRHVPGGMSNEALVQEFRRAPWLSVPAAALAALALSWLASIVLTFGSLPPGTSGVRARLLTLFEPSSLSRLGWALLLLVALAIAAFGERARSGPRPLWGWLRDGLVGASAVVAATAVIAFIIELTYLGSQTDSAVAGLLGALAVLPVAAAAIWWGVALGTRDPTPYVRQLSNQVSGLAPRARREASRRAGAAPAHPEAAGAHEDAPEGQSSSGADPGSSTRR